MILSRSIYFLALTFLLLMGSQAQARQSFELLFKNTGALDFEYETYEIPTKYKDKVGFNGPLDNIKQLEGAKKLEGNRLTLEPGTTAYIALVVKSKSAKDVKFFVAPHSNSRPEYELDFKFNCLCYHHIYHLEKGRMWFRVLQLKNIESSSEKSSPLIKLQHEFILWNGESPKGHDHH